MSGTYDFKGTLIQGFDLLDVTQYMIRTNKKFQATFLAELENLVDNEETFIALRKLYLDSSNNYLRTVVKTIFGGIEV